MNVKHSLFLKVAALLLAVLTMGGACALGWIQICEFDLLWGSGSPTRSRSVRIMQEEDYNDIRQLITLKQSADGGTSHQKWQEELEEALSAKNTNLRWQVRNGSGTFSYGNTEEEMPSAAYPSAYYAYFYLDELEGVQPFYEAWRPYAEGVYPPEEAPDQIVSDDWRSLLAQAVSNYQAGDLSIDLDAVYMAKDGYTDLLLFNLTDGYRLFAPSVRSVIEANQYGYIYDPDTGWRNTSADWREVTATLWLDPDLSVGDKYSAVIAWARYLQSNRVPLLVGTAALLVAWLLLTIFLCTAAGHRKGYEGISLCWFHRFPGDVLLALYICAGFFLCLVFCELVNAQYYWYSEAPNDLMMVLSALWGCGAGLLLTSFLLTLSARCKGGVVLHNMLLVRLVLWVCRGIKGAFRALPLIWKAALIGVAYFLLSLFCFSCHWHLVWALLTVFLLCYLCYWAYHWKLIRQGTREIFSGATDYRIDTKHMPPDLTAHADELNNLGRTITAAVDDRMRSEHFKAELITNVSHDLKTPLTSIINYVDLLKKEDIDNPKAAEYIEVLDRKSQRLKKLTEDLVEASKASTGSLTVVSERLDLVQLVDQALAEYQERLESQRLSIVRTLPAEPVWVLADGRHLWRVMDNLLSNCAKYALEGTRVYVEVQQFSDCAVLSVKNISREALNMDPDLLMERFVRGDESRTAEGSGLGLSIAQSLTDLQKGTFQISIDGDLFKATVTLPLAG